MTTDPPLFAVEDLAVEFSGRGQPVRAVRGVSFHVGRGETLGIVGESGSGKSVSAMAALGLVREPAGRVTRGRVLLEGRDLRTLGEAALRKVRGREVAMIFQDPMTSLNPVLTVGRQLTEPLEIHLGLPPRAARARAVELLALVGIPSPALRLDEYPHRFSGGMRQRVMIAMALACEPKLLIADEPTTALDVTIQAQILDLIRRLQGEFGTALILITHDLGVVAGMADRIAVMYGGRVVEDGPTEAVFAAPRMPYTAGLLASIPRLDDPDDRALTPIGGQPPDPSSPMEGCAFAPRCAYVLPECEAAPPSLRPANAAQRAACIRDLDLRPVPTADAAARVPA